MEPENLVSVNDYVLALKRLEEVFDAPVCTPESDEADLLAELIDDYENKYFPIEGPEK